MFSEVVKPWSLPKSHNAPDRRPIKTDSRQSVVRQLFPCSGGANINDLLREETNRNVKHIYDTYKIDVRDLDNSPEKTSIENCGQNEKTEKSTSLPTLIELELLNHNQKNRDEKRANLKNENYIEKITPSDHSDRGKCKASTSENQEDRQKRKHITDCFNIRKKVRPGQIKLKTTLELRTSQSNIPCPLDKTCPQSAALELTPKATRQFSHSKISETPDVLTNATNLADTTKTVAGAELA